MLTALEMVTFGGLPVSIPNPRGGSLRDCDNFIDPYSFMIMSTQPHVAATDRAKTYNEKSLFNRLGNPSVCHATVMHSHKQIAYAE